MIELGKVVGLIFLSALKFFFMPTISIEAGYSPLITILITTSGGILGFVLFFRFGILISEKLRRLFKRGHKSDFTKRNRLIIKIKSKYGIYGLAVLTPCLFGVPIGAILASLYYSKDKRTIPLFLTSIVIWSLILTLISKYLLLT